NRAGPTCCQTQSRLTDSGAVGGALEGRPFRGAGRPARGALSRQGPDLRRRSLGEPQSRRGRINRIRPRSTEGGFAPRVARRREAGGGPGQREGSHRRSEPRLDTTDSAKEATISQRSMQARTPLHAGSLGNRGFFGAVGGVEPGFG